MNLSDFVTESRIDLEALVLCGRALNGLLLSESVSVGSEELLF
jgi:hypothetical protein